MKTEHFKAILSASGDPLMVFEVDGRTVASEGHIAAYVEYLVTVDIYALDSHAGRRLIERWRNWAAVDWPVAVLTTEVYRSHVGEYFRFVDYPRYAINEAYYRTFNEQNVSWHWSGNSNDPLLVRDRGVLAGAVMPRRLGFKNIAPLPVAPTDAEVFEKLATIHNGYYLQGGKILAREIISLQSRIDELEARKEEKLSLLAELRDQWVKA